MYCVNLFCHKWEPIWTFRVRELMSIFFFLCTLHRFFYADTAQICISSFYVDFNILHQHWMYSMYLKRQKEAAYNLHPFEPFVRGPLTNEVFVLEIAIRCVITVHKKLPIRPAPYSHIQALNNSLLSPSSCFMTPTSVLTLEWGDTVFVCDG